MLMMVAVSWYPNNIHSTEHMGTLLITSLSERPLEEMALKSLWDRTLKVRGSSSYALRPSELIKACSSQDASRDLDSSPNLLISNPNKFGKLESSIPASLARACLHSQYQILLKGIRSII